ncbi:MAG: hypothetical protein IPK26_25450 [Planctomycetes bacterium]|nr:hypothetical protein [Planctomycetota bacterium]
MFPTLRHAFLPALLLGCLLPAAAPAPSPVPPLPIVTARLSITYVGNGYYMVVVSGQASQANVPMGIRVYGDDTWFDDHLFSIGVGFARTGFDGTFSYSQMVYRGTLNEDWEGTDEIYAIADVQGAGSSRTNTISRSF